MSKPLLYPIRSKPTGKKRRFLDVTAGGVVLLMVGWFVIQGLRRAPPLIPVKIASQDGVSVSVGESHCIMQIVP